MSEENKVRDAMDAAKGLAEAFPVYPDLIQPAAKEIGVGLQTVAKTIHIALAPISGLVWGYERIKEFVEKEVAEKLKGVPEEQIATPNPMVAGPLLEALKYAGHEDSLREMYANLLATSMDAKTVNEAHPCFVEIIRQMSPDEARIMSFLKAQRTYPIVNLYEKDTLDSGEWLILRNFSLLGELAGCAHLALCDSYLDNLARLGLIEFYLHDSFVDDKIYLPLVSHARVQEVSKEINAKKNRQARIQKGHFKKTALGFQFTRACVAGVEHKT